MPASAPTHPRLLRLAVVACLLFGLLAVHVSLRYLASALFGFAMYHGLSPVAPWLVTGGHVLAFAGLAVGAAVYGGRSGVALGTGLLLLSVEPLVGAFVWGDGCEVGGGAGDALLPAVTGRGSAVVVYAWNGTCSASIDLALVGTGVLLTGVGLWAGRVPDGALTRWLALLTR